MKKIVLALAASLLSMGASALDLAKYPQVLTNQKGVEVTVAPTTDGKQALVRITGVNHPIDKVVFLTDIQPRNRNGANYVTELNGGSYNLLVKNDSYGSESFDVYLPTGSEMSVGLNAARTKAVSVADMQAQYSKQNSQGVQKRLAQFDREKRLEVLRAELAQSDKNAAAACGAPVSTHVDWPGIDDKKMRELSISSFCGTPAEELARICTDKPAFKPQAAKLASIQCQFGSAMKIRTEGGKLVFVTTPEASNQGDFVKAYLQNQ